MPEQNPNHFRQIALLLISLTIITIGVIYNQAIAPPSQAQFFSSYTQNQTFQTTPTTPTANQPTVNIPPTPSTGTTPIVTPTPTIDTSTPSDNQIDTGIHLPEISIEDLWISLQLLNKLASIPRSFAYATPEINLPGIGATPADFTSDLPTLTPPSSGGNVTTPSINQTPDNEVIATLKDWTGYSKWEEFKTNFRTAQEQYAGTGRCMIDIQGLGCLVQW